MFSVNYSGEKLSRCRGGPRLRQDNTTRQQRYDTMTYSSNSSTLLLLSSRTARGSRASVVIHFVNTPIHSGGSIKDDCPDTLRVRLCDRDQNGRRCHVISPSPLPRSMSPALGGKIYLIYFAFLRLRNTITRRNNPNIEVSFASSRLIRNDATI